MTMKRELAITGIALVVSILLSSPSIAQTSKVKPAAAAPAVEQVATDTTPAIEEMPLDEALLFASSPEERTRLLVRCIGPRPLPPQDLAALAPMSEPAVIAEAPTLLQ